MKKTIFTWDLGATKCAAGIIEIDSHHQMRCLKTTYIKLQDTTSLDDLVDQLEHQLAIRSQDMDAICIGAAGHYDGEKLITLGAYPYPMCFAHYAKKNRWPSFAVVHDYTTVLCSTFTSYMDDADNIKRLNSAPIPRYGRRVALGIGTGLGLKDGVLLSNDDFWLDQNEMGHIGIASSLFLSDETQHRHEALLRFLNTQKYPMSFEGILSGPGLVRIYEFLYPDRKKQSPEEIGKAIETGKTPELMSLFAWYLGVFIGTVQLSFMPECGVWITGGVALRHLALFDHPDLIKGIHSLPAYLEQREKFPLGILCNPEHALLGGAYYAAKRLYVFSMANALA